MHSVVRFYSGPGASELFGLLEEKKADVETIISQIDGFVAYTLIRTDSGGVSVTVCKDKSGTDLSSAAARDWVAENAPDIDVSPPGVDEGDVILQIN